MVDLDVCKRRVELHIDVALPGRELERRHGLVAVKWGSSRGGQGRGREQGCYRYRVGCSAVQNGLSLRMNRRQIWESQV